ncbi:MAG: TldD/PmbA family protein [Thermodesulfovibrionales bacterium]|nr:TldD/PmbA family protein [Thermodesulfovibrionales bacterium]
MILPEAASKLLKIATSKGGDFADIFCESKSSVFIQLEDDRIEKVVIGSDSGVGIRLIYKGLTAYAFSNDFSNDTLINLAETVSKITKDQNSQIKEINLKRKPPNVTFQIKKRPNIISTSWKIQQVKKANEIARKSSNKIKQVKVIYWDSIQKVSMFNSTGFFAEDERIYTTATIQVVASDGDQIQTGYEAIGGMIGAELFDDNFFEQISLKASERSLMMLTAKRAPAGRMPVVISSRAGGTMIHEAIGHGLEADLAQQGLSVYSGKIGQQVASSVITVVDDGTIPFKRGSFTFDDEGTPSQKNILVNNGILENYMYDIYTSLIDQKKSTGNGRRQSYEHKPIPRMTNTYIAPGTHSPEEVIKSVHKGLFVEKMGGGQVNTITGDYVFEVQEGYLIENGLLGEPVRGATLIGNGPETLFSIDMVASDLGFSIGTCGKDSQGVPVSDAMPTLRIPEMVVGGEVR